MELWINVKKIFIGIVKYVFLIIVLVLSLPSYKDSKKANEVQERLIEVEEKLKKYEL